MTTPETPDAPVTPISPVVETPSTNGSDVPTLKPQTSSIMATAKPKGKNPMILVILSLVLIIILAVGAYLFWYNSKSENPSPNDGNSLPTISPSVIPTEEEPSMKTYTGDTDFSFTYSDILWRIEESTVVNSVPGMTGSYKKIKLINLYDNFSLDIGYKPAGDTSTMFLYGGAAGEFEVAGSVNFLGETISRDNLIYEGTIDQVQYNRTNEFIRGNTTFVIAILPTDFEGTLDEGNIEQAELVLKSFKLLPQVTNTSSKTYTSPILEDFSFEYPATWQLSVTEAEDVVPTIKLKANTVFLQKGSNTLTIEIQPVLLFGGEMECYKENTLNYTHKENFVEIVDEELKLITYHSVNSLKDKTHDPQGFQTFLDVWTPNIEDDELYEACGSLGPAKIEYTTNNYRATVTVKYFYPNEEGKLNVEDDVEDIVSSILEGSTY